MLRYFGITRKPSALHSYRVFGVSQKLVTTMDMELKHGSFGCLAHPGKGCVILIHEHAIKEAPVRRKKLLSDHEKALLESDEWLDVQQFESDCFNYAMFDF